MKTPSDDLFNLIKSLDTQEKVFFKVYSENKSIKKGALSYIHLFNAIDKLETYDESLLKARLKKTGLAHHFKSTKSYLTEAILKSLREYHSDRSVHAELKKLLDEAEVLSAKKLHKLAKKILLKAEQLALEHEMYDYLMVIYSLKKSMSPSIRNIKDIEDYLNRDALKEKQYLERLRNSIEFGVLAAQMRVMAARFSSAEEKKDIDAISSILQSPLLASPDKALSFSALKDYYAVHLSSSYLLNKWNEDTYQRQIEWINYLESDKRRLQNNTRSYFSALINLMLIQLRGRMQEVDKSYEKIKQFYGALSIKKRTKIISDSFAASVFNYIAGQVERGDPQKALKTWEKLKKLISFNTLNFNSWILGCDNLSQMYFMLGNYHEALKWANKVVACKEKNALNIQAMARIYLLLLHYELGNHDTLPYLAKSSRRFLIKHHYFSEFEKIIVGFFERKIQGVAGHQKKIELFQQLKKQLEPMSKNTRKIPALKYLDYISWAESKIKNRPFVEIVREKLLKNL